MIPSLETSRCSRLLCYRLARGTDYRNGWATGRAMPPGGAHALSRFAFLRFTAPGLELTRTRTGNKPRT
ncbi:hypothetical protein FTUN_3214 [Frigoriglobus tundricola]|uniref:Uncharacterized protein n=1 Tax=Frigoriglobus tundricola TaxID=2774151 RepID=A0A6M5YQG3_9BACT|nr:hypothetical protein FTUN_3214 [Frigoriglobus tundricola]